MSREAHEASWSDLEGLLCSLPGNRQPTREELRRAVTGISQPELLWQFFDALSAEPGRIEELSENAYEHVTGMGRVDLARVGQYVCRLHIWEPGRTGIIKEDRHNHVYNFASRVMGGVLATDTFKPSNTTDGDEVNVFQITTQTNVVKPVPQEVSQTRLLLTSPREGHILTAGNVPYTMSSDVIHRARALGSHPLVTLNIRPASVRDASTFFRDEATEYEDRESRRADVEYYLRLLQQALDENS